MSTPVKLPDDQLVYQACGDVVLIHRDVVIAMPYGVFGKDIDAAARKSLSDIEREGDRLRGGI